MVASTSNAAAREIGSESKISTQLFPAALNTIEKALKLNASESASQEDREISVGYISPDETYDTSVEEEQIKGKLTAIEASYINETEAEVEGFELGRQLHDDEFKNMHSGTRNVDPNAEQVCYICKKRVRKLSHLIIHLRTHSRDPFFTCPVCFYVISSVDSLSDHCRIHSSKPVENYAKQTYSFLLEGDSDDGEQLLNCPDSCCRSKVKENLIVISRKVSNLCMRTNLNAYGIYRSPEDFFLCSFCQKGFTSIHRLSLHKNIHKFI